MLTSYRLRLITEKNLPPPERFPGGFFKREARPSNEEILTMRLVDRVLRPLFPKDYHAETQLMIQLMSHDDEIMPDALAGLAALSCYSAFRHSF